MSTVPSTPRAPMDFNTRSMRMNFSQRRLTNHLVTGLAIASTVIVIIPLVAILIYLLYKGASSLNLNFFTKIPAPVGQEGGGMANSIVGSGVVPGACQPDGHPGRHRGWCPTWRSMAAAVCSANAIRFTADVLNGVPSIVMGIAVYALIVIEQKHFSAFAGGVALAIMMVPTITRTTEEMLATVPHSIREAATRPWACPSGAPTLSVSLRTASPGIITGCMLALRARRRRDGSAAVHGFGQRVSGAPI